MKEVRILVGGSGGQGVLLLGRLIAYGGMIEGKEVTCFPSYGAEMRGGTANSTVIISDDMIGSPIVGKLDILIAMNEASLKRFQPRIREKGLLIFDSSMIKSPQIRRDISSVDIPASAIAASIGGKEPSRKEAPSAVRSANMVMLGALIAGTGILKVESVINALERLTSAKSKKALEGNKEAIRKGMQSVADKKSDDI